MMNKIENWYKKNISKTMILIFLFISIIITIVQLFYFSTLSLLSIIATLLFIFNVLKFDEHYSFYLFISGMICLSFSSWFMLIIPSLFLCYVFYKLLGSHRVKRLNKLADSNPGQIAGVGYKDPSVEIIISGGRRK